MIKLKELREQNNITQIELAKILNVSNTTISNWEKGYREPDICALIKIADYFNVSLDYLLGREFKYEDHKIQILNKLCKVNKKDLYKINGYIDALLDLHDNV